MKLMTYRKLGIISLLIMTALFVAIHAVIAEEPVSIKGVVITPEIPDTGTPGEMGAGTGWWAVYT